MTASTRSGEFTRIARLQQIYARTHRSVALGIGDDCAVLHGSPHARVWTVDAAIAGVHFDCAWMSYEDVGYRALMAAASDVAAMGAFAESALSALIVPPEFDDASLYALAEGIAEAARACACAVSGGNLARGQELSITTSVLGEARARAVTRAGAKAGDAVYVTGVLGAAALGLAALSAGHRGDGAYSAYIAHFLRPRARFDRAQLLADVASAAIDVSDGLAQDLGHVARASGVDVHLRLSEIPRAKNFDALARALACDATTLLLAGGEDYELAFTARDGSVPAELATRVGHVEAGSGCVRVWRDDDSELAQSAGYDHFAAR